MKFFSAITLFGLCLALAGCGSSGSGGGGGNPAPNPAGGGGGGSPGESTTANPVGEPGPDGAYACYMIHKAADREVTTCAETAANLVPAEEARRICLSMRSPAVDVVWNNRGCSRDSHVGTCIGAVPQGEIKIKVRYYNVTEEEARRACLAQNPENQFTTEY